MTHTLANFGEEIFFVGTCGCYYPFTVYPIGTKLPNKSAVYIYIHAKCGNYTPLYIGQTEALDTHFLDRCVWRYVSIHFGNAIGVHFEKDKEARRTIERDLIRVHRPICNATSR